VDRGANVQVFNTNFENNTVRTYTRCSVYALKVLVPCTMCGSTRRALSLLVGPRPSRHSNTAGYW
jgi:hypothetical protein